MKRAAATTGKRARSKSPGASKKKSTAKAKSAVAATEESKKSHVKEHLQLFIAGCLIVPWLLAPIFQVPYDGFIKGLHLSKSFAPKNPLALVLVVASLSMSHVFYAWTWTHADTWSKLCHGRSLEPYKAFASCAHVIKFVQFVSLALWLWPLQPLSQFDMMTFHPLKLVLAIEFIGFGQILNVEVYNKIGEAGVYYGTRLGIDVPWVEGFPFSIVPHPQYFGAAISYWGGVLLFVNEQTVQEGIYFLGVVIALFYAFSSYTESYW